MTRTNSSIKRNAIIVGALIALILLIDQWIKIGIKSTFDYGETYPLIGDWFMLDYTENPGMAFGTKFGAKSWHKLALSIFRVGAITALCIYWFKQAKRNVKTEFLIALGLIIAGATGNLIDSMFYDYIFEFDPCGFENFTEGSGIYTECAWGQQEIRPHGFLRGNVVDMFKFEGTWPSWIPVIGGSDFFPAIWNFADASISIGVVMVFLRQRAYFPKQKKAKHVESVETITQPQEEDNSIN